MYETSNAQQIEKLRRTRLWLSIGVVAGVVIAAAFFIAGAVNASAPLMVAASSGFAALAAGWSAGFAGLTTKIKKLST